MARTTLWKRWAVTALMTSCSLPALAENQLAPLAPPPERPYPYEILGMQPGDDLDSVMAVFAERSDEEPATESEAIRVQSPNGRVFEFTNELLRIVGGSSVREAMNNETSDETLKVELASDVLEQRPIVVRRTVRQSPGELPEALALRAQLEETYGPPSKVEMSAVAGMTLIYAWSDEGFIPDLDAQTEREITFTARGGREETASYQPCTGTRRGAFRTATEYRFEHPRNLDIMPGCVAIFRVGHSGKPGQTAISFQITDYELARMNMREIDRQIIEALTSEQDVDASDMDL